MLVVKEVDDDVRTPEQKIADFVKHYPDKFLACRGDHHTWPQLKPGRNKDKNVRAYPHVEGTYVLEMRCSNCGKQRWRITGKGGELEEGGWNYDKIDGFSVPAKSGITRSDFVRELYRRFAENNFSIKEA